MKKGVHVPSEGVPLIKDVTYDMARGDVNIFGQDTVREWEAFRVPSLSSAVE